MAPISTWIAMELGLIAAGLQALHIQGNSMLVFFQTIPFRFYSLFSLVLLFTLIIRKRDYGSMLKAEIRARKTGEVYRAGSNPMITEDKDLLPAEGIQVSLLDVLIPIGLLMGTTFFDLRYNGYEEELTFRDAKGNAEMQLGERLVHVIPFSEGGLAVVLLPTLVFVTAMFVAFSTGTSWGTNSILMPIVIPVAANVSGATDAVTPLILACIGSVLTDAVFGDHCSPISDTTILSSSASGSDHIDHVKTQAP